MDISGLGGLSAALSQATTGDSVAILVQKKAMEAETQGAAQLLQAIPQPASNPAHLGQNIDVKA